MIGKKYIITGPRKSGKLSLIKYALSKYLDMIEYIFPACMCVHVYTGAGPADRQSHGLPLQELGMHQEVL